MRKIIILLNFIYLLLIFSLPCLFCFLPLLLTANILFKAIWFLLIPFVYTFIYLLVAGLLSIPCHKAIIDGKFPRNLNHPIYALRKLYGTCWTAIYYFKPLYFICLAIPLFKKLLFRLFGYRGSLNFTLYPDTWIRDLRTLTIEDNAYLSNRATLGTNMCLASGEILVKGITIKKNALIGHLAIIGPGTFIDENTEISVAAILGVNVKLGKNCHIGLNTLINHFSTIGNNVNIERNCSIGVKVVINDNLRIPAGMVVPDRTRLQTQAQINELAARKLSILQ